MDVFIAIGGNLGDRYGNFRDAVSLIAKRIGPVLHLSRVYETAPLVLPGRSAEGVPAYLNAALLLSSIIPPLAVLDDLQAIERLLGRDRKAEEERWMSRTIDLDLIGIGSVVVKVPRLTLPHPEMHKRDFVLKPLFEIAPDWIHPQNKKSVRRMLRELLDPLND